MSKFLLRLSRLPAALIQRARIVRLAAGVARQAVADRSRRPVAFFNASARLRNLSLNAAFSQLSAWSLRMAGVPVVHFVCRAGMTRCVLGTDPDDASVEPPCHSCIQQSERLYAGAQTHWFSIEKSDELKAALQGLDVPTLQSFSHESVPLGEIVLPSLRWALRRHTLPDNQDMRFMLREYILSAFNVAREFEAFLEEHQPQTVVLFNGLMYPEAMARRAAQARGIRVVTHEVGIQPNSAFFTEGQATAYPMEIPTDFQLDDAQDAQLNQYLEGRFQGRFTMAGIQFWPHMQALDEAFLAKATGFERIVPVFTNVIFDTSQIHANTLFPDMFAWLAEVVDLIKTHPDTLFVIRAHPDEIREGTRKHTRESVQDWLRARGVDQWPNVVFVGPTEYLSSYALIQRAHFVLVYNSSIGLEASILGKPVLIGGAARYTQYPTVYLPKDRKAFVKQARAFLAAANVAQPQEFVLAARRLLYFQLFRTSLPFDHFLQAQPRMGYVGLKAFPLSALLPENSPALSAVHRGIVDRDAFLV
ncbi:MAG: hypothetical protein DWG76_02060 [Chloroflexi bacterium]|nr:hypothetical protein [Chloroflexota bacterium]